MLRLFCVLSLLLGGVASALTLRAQRSTSELRSLGTVPAVAIDRQSPGRERSVSAVVEQFVRTENRTREQLNPPGL